MKQSINRAFDNQEEYDWQGLLMNSAIGVVTNTGSEFTTKGIRSLGDKVIKSDATKKQMEKMFKTEAKSNGKKIKNKELSKKLEKFNSIAADSIIDFNNEIYGDDR